jgi:hypothetical protein
LLCYYRSQHDNQSWLSALTAVLDTCALLIADVKGNRSYQAQLTFAMSRHAVVDLALVFKIPPQPPEPDRLNGDRLQRLRQALADAGLDLRDEPGLDAKLAELRDMYEPFVNAMARYFLFALPSIMSEEDVADNWQRSAWMPRTPGIGDLPMAGTGEEHFY